MIHIHVWGGVFFVNSRHSGISEATLNRAGSSQPSKRTPTVYHFIPFPLAITSLTGSPTLQGVHLPATMFDPTKTEGGASRRPWPKSVKAVARSTTTSSSKRSTQRRCCKQPWQTPAVEGSDGLCFAKTECGAVLHGMMSHLTNIALIH